MQDVSALLAGAGEHRLEIPYINWRSRIPTFFSEWSIFPQEFRQYQIERLYKHIRKEWRRGAHRTTPHHSYEISGSYSDWINVVLEEARGNWGFFPLNTA